VRPPRLHMEKGPQGGRATEVRLTDESRMCNTLEINALYKRKLGQSIPC
jgi:hypothetical protein